MPLQHTQSAHGLARDPVPTTSERFAPQGYRELVSPRYFHFVNFHQGAYVIEKGYAKIPHPKVEVAITKRSSTVSGKGEHISALSPPPSFPTYLPTYLHVFSYQHDVLL